MRLVQLLSPKKVRKVALVDGVNLLLIQNFTSVYDIVIHAMAVNQTFTEVLKSNLSESKLNYEEVWAGQTEWVWLPCFDHPEDVNSCMVSGTGLTHIASAENRNKMHDASVELTDSMKMYLMGEENGKPVAGEIGIQPEWFYKGNGTVLKGHLSKLDIPSYAMDGGEEPEVAGVYIINENGEPIRIGFATGNEYSDHVMEKINYLYLAPSKIRACSIGPELVIDEDVFRDISGKVKIRRNGSVFWQKAVKTGEENMAHSLSNLEYHHFKYPNHRVPGQVHIHFFGTGAFSFGDGIKLKEGDEMIVDWPQMGKPLVNTIKESGSLEKEIPVISLK